MANAICMAESHGNYLAEGFNTNGTIDRGIMQINSIHADLVNNDLTALYDPATNVVVAHQLWQHEGWKPWSTYQNGKYKQYL